MKRRSSILDAGAIAGLTQASGGGGGQANVSSSELRDLKLKLARSEK